MPAPAITIGRRLGILQLVDDVLPEINGIAHNFEWKRVFCHSGNDPEVAFRTGGNHDMVVTQEWHPTVSIVKLNLLRIRV